jgi:hypothetical protein
MQACKVKAQFLLDLSSSPRQLVALVAARQYYDVLCVDGPKKIFE